VGLPRKVSAVNVAIVAGRYLQSLQATGHSPHTLASVASCLHLFILFTGNIDISSAAQQAIAFLAKRSETVKPNSLCADFSHLKQLLLYSVRQGWLDRSPLDGMHSPRKEIVVTMPLSDTEILCILQAATQYERAMIVLLLGTGMRIGELAALRWQDVGEGVLLLHGKGNKQRTVAPGVAAMRELMRLPRETDKIFPWSREAIIARLSRLSRRSGVIFHAHVFRHSYANRVLGSMGIEELAEVMGHVSIETTRCYLRAYRRERMLEAMRLYSPADALLENNRGLLTNKVTVA